MWDFLAAVFPWVQKNLGVHLNRIVAIIVLVIAGWYAHVGTSKVIETFDKVVAIEKSVGQHSDKLSVISDKVTKLEAQQVTETADIKKVSQQVDTLQAVLVNKLNLILPPVAISERELEYDLCLPL